MTRYAIREVSGRRWVNKLEEMHALCLPSDVQEDYLQGRWWVAFDSAGAPVAFAGAIAVEPDKDLLYLSRVGVLPEARGRGLQRRLMRVIERAHRPHHSAVVSTTFDNPPSANNFIRLGYVLYEPGTRWGAEGTCYWIKSLKK